MKCLPKKEKCEQLNWSKKLDKVEKSFNDIQTVEIIKTINAERK